ncbi:peptidoglycan editing factor PgeF [Hippea jasoniae]|uniref:peptidoglycan editing factor PgeF n=1 Tax=Hippea jasoniae TaxID=944479 RepID=UPI000689DE95|nr:peptidoglycan editing factor PgeF [Hippea jasoniae]
MGFVEDVRFLDFNARCVFFNRYGGVSSPPFDELNFSFSVGDSPTNINENLKIVSKTINADVIATVNQVHSSKIVEYPACEDADGIYTFKTGVFLAIKFADCLPIALLDKKTGMIMAIHAGWRGSFLKIAEKAIDIFISYGSNPKDILVSIGPHICHNCYEVKEDVAAKFKGYIIKQDSKLYLNLSSVNIDQFIKKGLKKENIRDLSICTFENKAFFSYRRDKICGRHIGGIIKITS